MISWKVQNLGRLLTEVKDKFSGVYSVKDIRWSIEHNRCFINRLMQRFCSACVYPGDIISIEIEKQSAHFFEEKERIRFEDENLLVFDKPPFISSEALSQRLRCHLVHRLDRDTTGLIILAKTDFAQKKLEEQFQARRVKKGYLAIVQGNPGAQGEVRGRMKMISRHQGACKWGMDPSGVESCTIWKQLKIKDHFSLLLCQPMTGRTHQIRVHLAHIGYPIIGDFIYGSPNMKKGIFRPLLHAYRLIFTHPIRDQLLDLTVPMPADMRFQLSIPFKYSTMSLC